MMGQAEMEKVIKNLDHRVKRIEQILPTLATREDLREAIAPLATRDESIKTRTYIDQKIDETHTFMKALTETVRDDIRLLAEGHISLHQRIDRLEIGLTTEMKRLEQRIERVETTRPRRR